MTTFNTDDTIVARGTPVGRGGIAVIRVSGPDVKQVATGILGDVPAARYASFASFLDADGSTLDQGLALFFPGPASMVIFQINPLAPELTKVRHDIYFTSPEPTDQEQAFIDWIDQTLVPKDTVLCENVQRGLRSRGYKGAYLSGQESRVRRYHELIDDYIEGRRPASS